MLDEGDFREQSVGGGGKEGAKEAYVPLWCKTNCSFLRGASHPGELVEACAKLGIASVAVTDRDGVYGIVQAHKAATEHGVQLIVGVEVTVQDGSTIVLYAADREGYRQICRLLTRGRTRREKGAAFCGRG